ncbi:MAG: NFACT RNA binding domain-containing protein [Nanoarchaeota archaeon]
MEPKKYRWFYTSSGKLVVGGKNAEQNEEIVGKILKDNKKYRVMHTEASGSPFSIIFFDGEVTKKDLQECAEFTAIFSRAWREKRKTSKIHIFSAEQITKEKNMKTGTFRVIDLVKNMEAKLGAKLIRQKGVLRVVPMSVEGKEICAILQGAIPKEITAENLAKIFKLDKQEVLEALPSGGFSISKDIEN